MKILERLFRKRSLPDSDIRVSFNSSQISLHPDTGTATAIQLREVIEIVAFKVDLLSIDQINIGFMTSGSDSYYTVSEHMRGYKDLLSFLPEVFAGIRIDWFHEVAFPAFEENFTIMWTPVLKGTEQAG